MLCMCTRLRLQVQKGHAEVGLQTAAYADEHEFAIVSFVHIAAGHAPRTQGTLHAHSPFRVLLLDEHDANYAFKLSALLGDDVFLWDDADGIVMRSHNCVLYKRMDAQRFESEMRCTASHAYIAHLPERNRSEGEQGHNTTSCRTRRKETIDCHTLRIHRT